jgi:myo-inositol catabolism protein IolC
MERFGRDPKAADKFRSIGATPKSDKLPPAEHAAWSAICLALFNLDESLTRE